MSADHRSVRWFASGRWCAAVGMPWGCFIQLVCAFSLVRPLADRWSGTVHCAIRSVVSGLQSVGGSIRSLSMCALAVCSSSIRCVDVVGRSSSIHVAAAAHSTDARLFSGHSHTAGPAQSPRSHHWHAARLSLDLVVASFVDLLIRSADAAVELLHHYLLFYSRIASSLLVVLFTDCFITTCSIHELLDHCCSPVGSWFVHRFIRPLVRSSQLIAHHLVQRLSGWAVSVRRQACA
jgi:hypothetical protein